jgi:cell division protease FtsH
MRSELLDILCVLYGGIEAERLLLGDISTGASGFGDPRSDLARATELATTLVEACGMSQLPAPLRTFRDQQGRRNILSGTMAEAIDRQINNLLVDAQKRAAAILSRHVDELLAIRAELLEKKTLEGERVRQIIEDLRKRYPEEEISSAYSERKSPDPVGTIRETSALSTAEIVTSPSSQTST